MQAKSPLRILIVLASSGAAFAGAGVPVSPVSQDRPRLPR